MKIKYTKEILQYAVKDVTTISDALRKLGLRCDGGTHTHISKKIKKFGIDTSHILGRKFLTGIISPKKKPWQEILVLRNSDRRRLAVRLRVALIEFGREYKCEKCGLSKEWQNEKLVLQIDHINRQWNDDRPENLRFLCPNCHSQTAGWNGSKGFTDLVTNCRYGRSIRINQNKSKPLGSKLKFCVKCNALTHKSKSGLCKVCYQESTRKIVWPSKEELEKLVWNKPTMVLADELGVSDQAIAKWCKKYKINKPPRGYWAKQKALQTTQIMVQ